MKSKPFLHLILLLFLLSSPGLAYGQYSTRLWNNFTLGAPITQNWSARLSYMKSTNLNSGDFNTAFNWYSIRLNYKYDLNWNFNFGVACMELPLVDRTTTRVFAEGTYRIILSRRLVLKNSLQMEWHNKEEYRFDYRAIWSSRIGLRRRLEFLKVAPSLTYSLFFNAGGTPIQYFDEIGEKIARNPSLGIHRGRVQANFNFKLNPLMRLSVFYINQHEFNLAFSETRRINVLNPNTGRIQRPFNNQHIIGTTLSFNISPRLGDSFFPNF